MCRTVFAVVSFRWWPGIALFPHRKQVAMKKSSGAKTGKSSAKKTAMKSSAKTTAKKSASTKAGKGKAASAMKKVAVKYGTVENIHRGGVGLYFVITLCAAQLDF